MFRDLPRFFILLKISVPEVLGAELHETQVQQQGNDFLSVPFSLALRSDADAGFLVMAGFVFPESAQADRLIRFLQSDKPGIVFLLVLNAPAASFYRVFFRKGRLVQHPAVNGLISPDVLQHGFPVIFPGFSKDNVFPGQGVVHWIQCHL